MSRPDGPVRGGIVVVHGALGATPGLAAMADRLADEGYLAVAPHLFHRVDQAHIGSAVDALRADGLAADLGEAFDCLDELAVPADRRGVLGFGSGGAIALWVAATLPVAAAVTVSGSGVAHRRWADVPSGSELVSQLRAPWLGLYGDHDPDVPVEAVELLRSRLGTAGVAASIVRYPDAGADLVGQAGLDASADADSASYTDALTRMFGWFDAHLR